MDDVLCIRDFAFNPDSNKNETHAMRLYLKRLFEQVETRCSRLEPIRKDSVLSIPQHLYADFLTSNI